MIEASGDEDASNRKILITGCLIALLTVTIWACWLVGTRYALLSCRMTLHFSGLLSRPWFSLPIG